jgi:putative ABC transport system ATP-binding protein
MEILRVNGLTKIYGKGETKVAALDNVSFGVEKGEFVAVIGASGSGKSTLLHLLGGVDRPTAVKFILAGNDIGRLNESEMAIFRRRNIGIIYQFYNLIPILNVEENINLPRLLDNRKPDTAKLASILKTIGLTDRMNHLPSELSGGQQQRVSIGRALINDPAVILADEPTGNLDSKSSREVIELLKLSNKRDGQTLIIITHDDNIALQADRVITIGDGRILRDERIREEVRS